MSNGRGRRKLVLWTVALLVVIRLFTEIIHVLPGFAKLVDIPLLGVLLFAVALQPSSAEARDRTPGPFFLPGLLFLAISVLSVLTNLTRVSSGAVALFLYGFLGPLAFYYAAYRLWPPGGARSFSRLLVGLGLLQFVVVGAINMPRFLRTGNPDLISGTFGENAYQLVFFLIVFVSLVAGIAAFEPGRLAGRFATLLVAGSLTIIFLAQYRALLFSTGLGILATGLLLNAARVPARRRSFMVGVGVFAAFVASLGFVAVRFPETKILPYVDAVQRNPIYFLSTRFAALGTVGDLFADRPAAVLVGTGPGTFSSRAWLTFANPYSPRAVRDPVSRAVSSLTGGEQYHTDVSDHYVLPQFLSARAVLGSKSINSPFSSYTSLLAEVGLLGFLLLVGIYAGGMVRAARMTLASIRSAQPVDALPALLLAATIALFVLLQMALLGNWLEVARITVPSWILLAVATKEFDARHAEKVA